jgi:hypothetical protein
MPKYEDREGRTDRYGQHKTVALTRDLYFWRIAGVLFEPDDRRKTRRRCIETASQCVLHYVLHALEQDYHNTLIYLYVSPVWD